MSQEKELSEQERQRLLQIARQSVEAAAKGERPPPQEADLAGLARQRGAFVTLKAHGQLRGCIGNFQSHSPLHSTVQEMAVAAACQDPRFSPVRPAELDDLDLEISVLSPLREISDVSEIEVGTHGIYIISPRGRGVLLPQVAVEYGWDRDTFLEHTCQKAGLPSGCWREPDVRIMIFSAQIFGEKD